jgi:hypothetical protein
MSSKTVALIASRNGVVWTRHCGDVAQFAEWVAYGHSLGGPIPKGPFWLGLLSPQSIELLREEIIVGDILIGGEIPPVRFVTADSSVCALGGEIVSTREFAVSLLGDRGDALWEQSLFDPIAWAELDSALSIWTVRCESVWYDPAPVSEEDIVKELVREAAWRDLPMILPFKHKSCWSGCTSVHYCEAIVVYPNGQVTWWPSPFGHHVLAEPFPPSPVEVPLERAGVRILESLKSLMLLQGRAGVTLDTIREGVWRERFPLDRDLPPLRLEESLLIHVMRRTIPKKYRPVWIPVMDRPYFCW